jgi:hypothetical protein
VAILIQWPFPPNVGQNVNAMYNGMATCFVVVWVGEFAKFCATYGITHQHTSLVHPHDNDMDKCTIKMIKHGFFALIVKAKCVNDWDLHIPHLLFGCRCGVQNSTMVSPYLIVIS